MRILYATPETSDFVQVGGLAAVSSALPRALLPLADIRIVVPGYPQVLRGLGDLKVIGHSSAHAGLPAFRIGKGHARDGMPYYVVMCPELFERPGSPYGDTRGVDWQDNDVRFATFSYAAAQIALGAIDREWSAHLVHANDWQSALIPAYLEWS
uniref:glycogen/starch synthase n=1 Tax=Tardiphaga sp. TaxID=1926292 RepID=UPI0037DA11C6